jgi:hypothetical protein
MASDMNKFHGRKCNPSPPRAAMTGHSATPRTGKAHALSTAASLSGLLADKCCGFRLAWSRRDGRQLQRKTL